MRLLGSVVAEFWVAWDLAGFVPIAMWVDPSIVAFRGFWTCLVRDGVHLSALREHGLGRQGGKGPLKLEHSEYVGPSVGT